jgi:hypothetical protein
LESTGETSHRDLLLARVTTAIASAGVAGSPSALLATAQVAPETVLAFSERATGVDDLDLAIAATILGARACSGAPQRRRCPGTTVSIASYHMKQI